VNQKVRGKDEEEREIGSLGTTSGVVSQAQAKRHSPPIVPLQGKLASSLCRAEAEGTGTPRRKKMKCYQGPVMDVAARPSHRWNVA